MNSGDICEHWCTTGCCSSTSSRSSAETRSRACASRWRTCGCSSGSPAWTTPAGSGSGSSAGRTRPRAPVPHTCRKKNSTDRYGLIPVWPLSRGFSYSVRKPCVPEPPSQGGDTGSNPVGTTQVRAISWVRRARGPVLAPRCTRSRHDSIVLRSAAAQARAVGERTRRSRGQTAWTRPRTGRHGARGFDYVCRRSRYSPRAAGDRPHPESGERSRAARQGVRRSQHASSTSRASSAASGSASSGATHRAAPSPSFSSTGRRIGRCGRCSSGCCGRRTEPAPHGRGCSGNDRRFHG